MEKNIIKVVLIFIIVFGGTIAAMAQCDIYKTTSVGGFHTLVIKRDGSLWSWGDNIDGQLGDGTNIQKNSPVQISVESWKAVSAGAWYSLAIKSDGSLWAWGANNFGQLGDGTTLPKNQPVRIGADNTWKSVHAGKFHSFAIKTDGSLWAWGHNMYGQLGDGTKISKTTPVKIGTDNNWASASPGTVHSLAIKTDGSLWRWGYSHHGKDHTYTYAHEQSPVRVGTDNSWKTAQAAETHNVALKTDGTIWSWGENYNKILGSNSNRKPEPTIINLPGPWKAINTTVFTVVAVKTDGSLWGWGYNGYGQIGNGTNEGDFLPVQIGSATWADAQPGYRHILAEKNNNIYAAWGSNDYGQYGAGNDISSNTPVKITNYDYIITLAPHASVHSIENMPDKILFNNSCQPIATLQQPPTYTGITGAVTAKVWVQNTSSAAYVKRHFEITPYNNPNTASGRVTLYFTQQEFNDFNNINTNTLKLPANPTDAPGKANLLIEKRSGSSNGGSGVPSSYTGSSVNINPADENIIWNDDYNRWEVSFETTGFSGFFAKTQQAPLYTHEVTITANPGNVICSGTSVTFTATHALCNNVSYQWKLNGLNVGGNSATYTSSTLSHGDKISVIVTGASECAIYNEVTSNEITITFGTGSVQLVMLNATPTHPVCNTGTGNINVVAEFSGAPQITPSYKWYKDGSAEVYSTDLNLNNIPPGNYRLEVTVTGGENDCAKTFSTSTAIIAPAQLTGSVSPSASVSQYSTPEPVVSFSAVNGAAPYSYRYSINNGDVQTVTSSAPISFTQPTDEIGSFSYKLLSISDANECTAVLNKETIITVGTLQIICPSNIIATSNTSGCNASLSVPVPTVVNNAAISILTWVMTGATTGQSPASGINYLNQHQIFNVGVTTITYTAFNQSGYSNSCSFTVTVNPAVITVSASNATTCTNGFGNITITATGGKAPYTYSVNGGTYNANNNQSLPPGIHQIIARDANGCTGITTTTVSVANSLTTTVVTSPVNCENAVQTGSITITASGGVAPYAYSINGGTFQTGNIFNNLNAGQYIIQVKDAAGCSTSASVAIGGGNSTRLIALEAHVIQPTCNTNTGTITTRAEFSGNNMVKSYKWYKDGGSEIFAVTPNLLNVPAGTYLLEVSVSTENSSCVNKYYVSATVHPNAITTTITGSQLVITGSTPEPVIRFTALGGTAPYNFVYTVNDGAINNITAHSVAAITQSTTQAGTYIYKLLTVTDATGCAVSVNKEVVVTIVPQLTPDLSVQLTVLPAIARGRSDLTGIIKVFEINGVPTNSPVSIFVSKDDKITVSFNPGTNIINGTPVNNTVWSLNTSDNPGFYKFTTNIIIPANATLAIGFDMVFNPGNTTGSANISAMIAAGSGGDNRLSNNTDSENITYFMN